MTQQNPADGLAELCELNRLFLTFLRARLGAGRERFGLPGQAASVLADAPDGILRRLAAYPQALFRLDFDVLARREIQDAGAAATADAQTRSLQLMLLVSIRHLSRQHPYGARLYLRLSAAQVHELSNLAILDLPELARRESLIGCAYNGLQWLWTELVNADKPDRVRVLILLGLQPMIELNAAALLNR